MFRKPALKIFSKINEESVALESDRHDRLDQTFIIKKIMKWLTLKKYKTNFNDEMEDGLCAGFTTAWLYYHSRGKEAYFYHLLSAVSSWDEMSENQDDVFIELMNALFWFQSPENLIQGLMQTRIQEKINLIISEAPFVSAPEFQISCLFSPEELIIFLRKIIPTVKDEMTFISNGVHICGLSSSKKKVF